MSEGSYLSSVEPYIRTVSESRAFTSSSPAKPLDQEEDLPTVKMSVVENVASKLPSEPVSVKDKVLETGASMVQSFAPVNKICAHLNAFHSYASDPKRCVEANHYCSHISPDVRQCLIYDSAESNARLIGVEYMITPALFETLDPEERKLWHSHVFEVKSGMLIMPGPNLLPTTAWEVAETKEMEEVISLYGKTYHFWQVDRGDKLPLGGPELMMSFTQENQCPPPGFKEVVGERDLRYQVDHEQKAKNREYVQAPNPHPDADSMWKQGKPTASEALTDNHATI